MKKLLNVLLMGVLFIAVLGWQQPAQASTSPADKIDQRVLASLSQLQPDALLSVIVTLRQQADVSASGLQNRSDRLQAVIGSLQANARASQRAIVAVLEAGRQQGLVSRVTPFWIFNGLSVTATPEMIQQLAAREDVMRITPDAIDILPSGSPALAAPAANLVSINVPDVWSLGFLGQGVVVASLDTGVDVSHPDLASRWRGGSNSWYDPYGQMSTPGDLSGHGTWTMGVMVAGDASGTTLGAAPDAQWIAARIFNNSGSATATAIHLTYQWVLDPDGDPATADAPNVVNNSWTFSSPGCNLEFQYDLLALRAAGILPVFAAGNFGPGSATSASPANYPEAFAVGAVDNTDVLYLGSSRGPSACGEASTIYPELVAPGVNIPTTDLVGSFTQASGTSLSAPHVSGVLALLLSAFPGLSAENQAAALTNTALDLGSAGPDNDTGYGRLDALAAYHWLAAGNSVTPTPQPTPTFTPSPTFTPTPDPLVNLALNQPASVSSYQDSGSTGSNAVDGDYATLWKTAKVSGKNKPPSEWITIDLGTNATVGRVVLEWDAYYATQYTIQVSADSTSWSTVYAVSGGDGGNDTLDFSQTSARYVKLETTGWNNSSFRDWLKEIEIYAGNGVPAPSPTPSPTPAPSPTPTATPPPSGGGSLHIGDLDGSGTSVNRKNWSASVTVVVHDANENLISGVSVSGAWSSGVSGGTSCVTGGSGSCVIASGNINKNIGSAVFSVIDASSSGFTYDAASNHDPDGDSDGSSILIPSP